MTLYRSIPSTHRAAGGTSAISAGPYESIPMQLTLDGEHFGLTDVVPPSCTAPGRVVGNVQDVVRVIGHGTKMTHDADETVVLDRAA